MDDLENMNVEDDELEPVAPKKKEEKRPVPPPAPAPAPQRPIPTSEEAREALEGASDQRSWYVIHCYSGYENKVRHNLEQRIETMGMKDKIFDVVIPTQEEIEVREGKRRTVERHIFPGYVLVNMILSEESWYVVRNTPSVTGFIGAGTTPTPLARSEVDSLLARMGVEELSDAPTLTLRELGHQAPGKLSQAIGILLRCEGMIGDPDDQPGVLVEEVAFAGAPDALDRAPLDPGLRNAIHLRDNRIVREP